MASIVMWLSIEVADECKFKGPMVELGFKYIPHYNTYKVAWVVKIVVLITRRCLVSLHSSVI